jgi:hypothetical protein
VPYVSEQICGTKKEVKFEDQVRGIGKRHYYLRGREQHNESKEESKELR